jgi:hypothetical protein
MPVLEVKSFRDELVLGDRTFTLHYRDLSLEDAEYYEFVETRLGCAAQVVKCGPAYGVYARRLTGEETAEASP